jgi:hypothetical protein
MVANQIRADRVEKTEKHFFRNFEDFILVTFSTASFKKLNKSLITQNLSHLTKLNSEEIKYKNKFQSKNFSFKV